MAAALPTLSSRDAHPWLAPAHGHEALELERVGEHLVDGALAGCDSSLVLRAQLRGAAQELASYLPIAVRESRPALLFERISWLRPYLSHRGVDEAALRQLLESFAAAVSALPAQLPRGRQYAQAAPAALGLPDRTPLPHVGGPGRLAAATRAFARALRDLDDAAAWRLACSPGDDGVGPDELGALVIEPALAEMGRLWQLNRLGAGHAHAAFLVARRVLARLPNGSAEAPAGAWVVVAAVPGEQHTLGAAVAAQALARAGWRVADLGASRAADILAAASDLEPRLVALSATQATALPSFRALANQVRACAAQHERPPLRILAGGRVFAQHEGLAADVGADAFAAGPLEAVSLARRLAHDA